MFKVLDAKHKRINVHQMDIRQMGIMKFQAGSILRVGDEAILSQIPGIDCRLRGTLLEPSIK